MACQGICIRYKADKIAGHGHYIVNHKRCQVCEIFINWEGLWCPCCNFRLRTLPRNASYKEKYKIKKGANISDEEKLAYIKKHDPELYNELIKSD